MRRLRLLNKIFNLNNENENEKNNLYNKYTI